MELRKENSKIIIVSGKARSGKDKTTLYLKEEYIIRGKRVISLSYAKYLKEYAINISDWDGKDETKPREFLQNLGTEIIRNQIDEEFFIKRMIEDIKVYSYFFDVIIISDARFASEIDLIRNNFDGVVSINVLRPGFVNELTEKEKSHSTETGLDNYSDFDYIIINDSTLESLEEKVKGLVEAL